MSSQEEIVIVVMGSTGTGKSSFINLLTGDNTVKIGNTLNSETSEIQLIRFIDPASRRKVVIVDTPGFDDSRSGVTNTNVLTTITEFLLEEYDKDRKINGLVYLHRISDTRFGGQASHNLKLFKSLCGRDNFKNVVALTTFWDRVDDETGRRREAELKAKFMKDLVEGGAHFMRHDRSMEGARKVLKHILTLASTNLRIQEEIRVEGKSLEDTDAGSVHGEEVERLIAKHKKDLVDLRMEMETMKGDSTSLRRELEEERVDLQDKLARIESEKSALQKGVNKFDQTIEPGEERKNALTVPPSLNEEVYVVASRENFIKSNCFSTTIQFAYTGRYPPFLKIIPRRLQTPVNEIFDFTSLVQTTAMIFTDPNLLPKIRNRAPDVATTRTMQDLVDRNLRLHIEAQKSCVRDMYTNVNIGFRDDWYTDAIFGQQQFTGTNPTSITLASPLWVEKFKAAACVQQCIDAARLMTEDPRNIYVQDYSHFRSAMGISPMAEVAFEGRYACSSVTLFHLEPAGKLHPLAITLDYKGSMEGSVTIFNRRVTSSDLGDESSDWPWRYAKMCAQVSDWFHHEVTVHLLYTHLVEEVLIVAAYRTLDPSHVVFSLLEPHWKTTLSLNLAARDTLVPKIIIPLTGYAPAQVYSYIQHSYRSWNWTGCYVPNDLNTRGFPVKDLDQPKYHKYGYARNIIRTWGIIRRFVSMVLTEVYVGGDAQVAADREIVAFCQEVKAHNGGQMDSFPNIQTLEGLIDFVTMCIHIASPQHTAVNYLQQYYQTFIPNKPSALYKRLPQSLEELKAFGEREVLAALPVEKPKDWLVMAQVPYLLSFEVAEENTILQYATDMCNSYSTRQSIRRAAAVLKDDLEAFSCTVSDLNIDIGDQQTPYYVLDPKRTAVSILI